MRETLTIFAGLLIVILTAALIGPYFVDWTAQRGWIESLLSEATGARVEVAGAIDVKLLPTPSLRLGRVVLQGAAPSDPSFRADDVDLEMAVAPLLRGEVQFIKADFRAPEVHLTLDAGGNLILPRAPAALPAEMQFSAISIQDGRLTIDDASHKRRVSLAGLDLDAQAGSLIGPFKGIGRVVRRGGDSVSFRFNTTARQGNGLGLKAIVEPTARSPAASFDGALDFAGTADGATALSFNGTASLSGTLPVPDSSRLPWKITGPLVADIHHAVFSSVDVHLGDEDRALNAKGSAEFDFGDVPQGHVALTARQVDLDRLLARKNASAAGILRTALTGALADPNFAKRLRMPLHLAFNSPAMVLGGDALTDVAVDLDARAGAPLRLGFQADGPGGSRLSLAGSVETGPAADFKGHVAAVSHDTISLADWLGPIIPQFSGDLRSLPFHILQLSGDGEISAAGFAASNMHIEAGHSALDGSIAFTRAIGSEHARFFADLDSDALDIDALPDLSGLAAAARGTDLALTLDARAVRIARFGSGMVDAGRIHLELEKSGAQTNLKKLSIADLGGASVNVTGQATPRGLSLNAKLDAERLRELADLIDRVAPGAAADALVARAKALSPAHLSLSAKARVVNGHFEPLGLRLEGTAAGSRIDASVNPATSGARDVTARLRLTGSNAPLLLRQIGLEAVPLTGFGGGRIDVDLSGRAGRALDTHLEASLAGTDFTFNGRLMGSPLTLLGQGDFALNSGNVSPLLEIATIPLPDVTEKLAASLTGHVNLEPRQIAFTDLAGSFGGTKTTGSLSLALATVPAKARLSGALHFARLPLAALRTLALGPPRPIAAGAMWSKLTFGPSLVNIPTADLALSAENLVLAPNLSGIDAKLHLRLAPGKLTLSNVEMGLDGGHLGGRLTLRRDKATALVDGAMRFDGLAFLAPYASGRASGRLDFAASGQSEAMLVANLAGSGTVRLSGLTLQKTDPSALTRIITQTDQSTLSVDEPEVHSALDLGLDHSPLHLADATYHVGLAAGELRLARRKGPSAGDADFTADFDLPRGTIDARVDLTATRVPRDWQGPKPHAAIVWHGPIGAATRSLDSTEFFNALAARALARAAARVDMLEQDIRERAYFNRYLKGLEFLHKRRREIAAYQAEQTRRAQAARRAAALKAKTEQTSALPSASALDQQKSQRADIALPPPAPPQPINGRLFTDPAPGQKALGETKGPATALASPASPQGDSPFPDDPIQRITRFITQYDAGACLFIRPVSVTVSSADVEGYGASLASFQAFDRSFLKNNGFKSNITMRHVTPAQCPAVTFLNHLRNAGGRKLRLDIKSSSFAVGQPVAGTITGYGRGSVDLLVVSASGLVFDLSNNLKNDGDTTQFALPVQRSGDGTVEPRILMAVACSRPLATLHSNQPAPAVTYFPALLAEAARQGLTLSVAARYLTVD